jgi:hypothetical protein
MKGETILVIVGGLTATFLILRHLSSQVTSPKAPEFAPKVGVPSSTDLDVKATTNVRSSILAPGKEVTYNNGNVFATYNAAGQLIRTVPV